ncbi:hypothetical protein GE09DRAFT_1107118, partial [Coniochaeta sp. 2T2.1]
MPLQKSFSEQKQGQYRRQQWQRSKSNPVPAQASRPLLPVSEKTKNKLQKFQFLPPPAESDESGNDRPKSDSEEADKENALPVKRADATPAPATRLVWQDLMGEKKTPQQDDDDEPPVEQLLWHNIRDEVSQRISPMIGRRKRKRARSSSPASSPSHAMPTTPAVNVKELTQALKTPNADPTLQLWDRFTLPGGNAASPSGLTNPLISHLLVSSSPRPARDGAGVSQQQSEGGLRRAISLGTQWPKRRKIFQHGPDSNVTSQGSPNGDSKSSMVSALLKTVTGELNKSVSLERHSEPLKSPSPSLSPLKRSNLRRSASQSPSRRLVPPNKPTETRPIMHFDTSDSAEEARDAGKSSSDYGDDDFDEDTLLELDATVYTIPDEEPMKDAAATEVVMPNEQEGDTTTMDED